MMIPGLSPKAHSIVFDIYVHTDTMGYWGELRAWLLRDPAKLIRYLVLFVCSIVVIVQLYECFAKLSDPPISTHSYYNINETIEMPAITLCRQPPFKEDVLTVSVMMMRILSSERSLSNFQYSSIRISRRETALSPNMPPAGWTIPTMNYPSRNSSRKAPTTYRRPSTGTP